jgi:hypothetical protein
MVVERRGRSISSLNHSIVRHEFSIPALSSLATGGRARGLDGSTNAYPLAPERVLAAEMRNKLTVEPTHAATFGACIATDQHMKNSSESQSTTSWASAARPSRTGI